MKAFPGPGFFSRLARERGPAGLSRRQSTAAVDQGQLHIMAQGSVVAEKGQVDGETFLPCRLGEPCSHAVPVGWRGELLPNRREVVRTVRLLEGREPLGPFASQRPPAPGPRRPHLHGRDRGLRAPPATEEDSALLGGERVVFRLAPMESLHLQGMA